MKIETESVQEYIVVCIAITGEINECWLRRNLSRTHSSLYVRNSIKKLINEGQIKRSGDGILRLKKPKGLTWLEEFSPELYLNYMLMSENHTFAGGVSRIARREKVRTLHAHFIDNGVPVNFFDISIKSSPGRKPSEINNTSVMDVIGIRKEAAKEYRSVFSTADNKTKDLLDLFYLLDEKDTFFLTAKVVRKEAHNEMQTSNRKNMSRIFGVLASGTNFFPVYCIDQDFEWKVKIESQTNLILRNTWWKRWGDKTKEKQIKEGLKGRGIFYYTNAAALDSMAAKIKGGRVKGFQPWDIFDSAYYIPIDDNNIEQIILTDNHAEKIKTAVFGNSKSENAFYDAVIGNNPVWELLTNDITKIKKIKTVEDKFIVAGKELIFICHKWQEDFIKTVFVNPKVVCVTDQETTQIIHEIKK